MEIGTISQMEIITRLFVAVLLGMSLGVERAAARKTAGMRTYGLVSLGAALFTIISLVGTEYYWDAPSLDPLRVASQVVVGIGFLGAGIIIFHDRKVRGLTTAAGLWIAAGIGVASAYGLYIIAAAAALITLILFTFIWYIERYIQRVSDSFYDDDDDDDDF